MNEFDATHAWLEADGKQFFGFGGHFYLPKDNSKKNREALLQDFKRRLSQPWALDEVTFFNISYKQIPESDY